jgi:hypothetical protein
VLEDCSDRLVSLDEGDDTHCSTAFTGERVDLEDFSYQCGPRSVTGLAAERGTSYFGLLLLSRLCGNAPRLTTILSVVMNAVFVALRYVLSQFNGKILPARHIYALVPDDLIKAGAAEIRFSRIGKEDFLT